jgi:GT2 family glycosyltransferase
VTISAILSGGLGPARALPVRSIADGLGLDLAAAGLAGAWVTILLTDDPGAARNARILMSLVAGTMERPGPPLAEEALGGGLFAWTGRLPEDVRELRIAGLVPGRPMSLARIEIRRRGRPALVARGLARDPSLTIRAVYWRSLGKRVRGRAFLDRALRHRRESGYNSWIRRSASLSDADRTRIRTEVADWPDAPLISVLMPVHDPAPRVLRAAVRSLQAQLYPNWELCICDDASRDARIVRLTDRLAAQDPRIRVVHRPENGHIARATNDALALARGPYVAFLDHDDALAEQALYEVARTIRDDPGLVLIYSDEDKIEGRGRRFEPHFKSGFDRELLYGQNYINHLTVIRTEAVRSLGGLRPGFEGSQDHDLLLRLTETLDPTRIRHIPMVLYHWRAAGGSGTFSDRALARAEAARLQAVSEVAERRGARAERGPFGFTRVVHPLPHPAPRVSVIIPTRDRAELLRVTLDGLFGATDYPDIEVIVVDNDSRESETEALFARYRDDARLVVVRAPGPFNFSDLSNRGAAAATGPVLLFLNNDIEVIEPGWLTEMVSQAVRPEIGAVGAKLLYPDGTIQHGGVVLGIGGVAGHSHLGVPDADPGYFARMVLVQEVSAVTGACLAMRSEVFRAVGGFDAETLKVAFNDIDLCLKIREAGYRILWTPFAKLVHHESKSRGPEDTPEKRARFQAETAVMQERWGALLRADPYYNINLSRISAHYRL